MNNIQIYYFSGTGNTQWVAKQLKSYLSHYDLAVAINSIEEVTEKDVKSQLSHTDHLIIGFPVYGSAPPRLMQRFVENLPVQNNDSIPLTVYATHALASGDSAYFLGKKLEEKGYRLVGTRHFIMMNNFHLPSFRFYKPQNGVKAEKLLKNNVPYVENLANEVFANKSHIIGSGVISAIIGNLQRRYVDAHINKLAKIISVDKIKCINCGLCIKICPTENIEDNGNGITFLSKCMGCMRCYSRCPKEAILFGEKSGDTKKYPRYKGPKNTTFINKALK